MLRERMIASHRIGEVVLFWEFKGTTWFRIWWQELLPPSDDPDLHIYHTDNQLEMEEIRAGEIPGHKSIRKKVKGQVTIDDNTQ